MPFRFLYPSWAFVPTWTSGHIERIPMCPYVPLFDISCTTLHPVIHSSTILRAFSAHQVFSLFPCSPCAYFPIFALPMGSSQPSGLLLTFLHPICSPSV